MRSCKKENLRTSPITYCLSDYYKQWKLLFKSMRYCKEKKLRTSLITNCLSSFLKKGTKTLKNVNLGYSSFNFNHPLEFSVKSYKNLQNTPHFL
jgi:hypothetical protein